MRRAALVVISAALLAACNPSGQTASEAGGGGGLFPDLTSSAYRAEATITAEDGQTAPIVMIRDGNKLRMEMSTPQGDMVIITNPDSGEDYAITSAGGQRIAMRLSQTGAPVTDPSAEWQGEMATNATRTGNCSAAGENGAEWTRTEEGEPARTACVTNDGIILRATEAGRTVWETTSVQRGAQSADLFTLPSGVEVLDLGNMGSAMQGMIERAQGGQ